MTTATTAEVVAPGHARWDEFCALLEGPDGCNFKQEDPADESTISWECGGGFDKTIARRLLAGMGFGGATVEASLSYYEAHGGHCDCEILFNVR